MIIGNKSQKIKENLLKGEVKNMKTTWREIMYFYKEF